MQLWQLDVTTSAFLADGREVKIVTGIDDHSRYCEFGAGGQRPVRVQVGAQDVGQDDRVAVVGFAARDGVPVPVAGHRHRVDRVDGAAGGAQARDQQPARGLDRHRDRVPGGVAVLGQQAQQLREPGRVIADAAPGQQLAVLARSGRCRGGLRPSRYRRTLP
jgi:hypothetical protein